MSQISFTGPVRSFALTARKLEGINASSFTRYCSVTFCVCSALSFPLSWAGELPAHASAKDKITTGKNDHLLLDIRIVYPQKARGVLISNVEQVFDRRSAVRYISVCVHRLYHGGRRAGKHHLLSRSFFLNAHGGSGFLSRQSPRRSFRASASACS